MPLVRAQSISDVTIAPDCEIRPRPPGLAPDVDEAGIEPACGRDQAERVGPDDAQQMRPRRIEHLPAAARSRR